MAKVHNQVPFAEFEPLFAKALENANVRDISQATGIPDSVYYMSRRAGTIKLVYFMALKGYLAERGPSSAVNLLVSINGKGVTSRAIDKDLQKMSLGDKSFIMVPIS